MHHTATILTWIAAVLGAALLIYGLAGALSERGGHRTLSALGCLWLGLFVLIETGPRLAGWSSGWVLALSVLALAPLGLAGRQLRRV